MWNKTRFNQALIGILLIGLIAATGYYTEVRAVPGRNYQKLELFTDILGRVENLYVDDVDTDKLIVSAINGMLMSLDPHSSYMDPAMYKEMQTGIRGEFGGLGIEIQKHQDGSILIVSPIEDTPAFKAGIEAGDKIIEIEDESTMSLTLMDAVKRMRGKPGTKITITIIRPEFTEPKKFTIIRAIIRVKSVRGAKLYDDGYGYIRVSTFQDRTAKELDKALKKLESGKGLKGLVLDFRYNPGGPLKEAIDLVDLFIDKGVIVSTRGRINRDNKVFKAHSAGTHPNYPIIMIINEGSASASEIVAGALQDHGRAAILGMPSFGKGSVQTIFELKDGSGLKLTTSLYYTPSGRSIQAKGIEPDIVVKPLSKDELDDLEAKSKEDEGNRFVREKDLDKHIEIKENKDVDGEEKLADEKKEEEMKLKRDPQLRRALELLKTWEIFKGLMEKRAAAK